MADKALHGTAVHRDVGISSASIEIWRKFDHMSAVVDPKLVVDRPPSRTSRDMWMGGHPSVSCSQDISIALVVVNRRSVAVAAPA